MNEGQRNSAANDGKKAIRWEVFLPAYLVVGGSAVLGILNKDALKDGANAFFFWSLDTFGWLYQIAIMACVILTTVVTFSRLGSVRLGGRDAKPKYGFWTWFAMTLTGGVATGIVTWGVNEPLIYYGNVWGELNQLGIPPTRPRRPYSPWPARSTTGRSSPTPSTGSAGSWWPTSTTTSGTA